MRSGAIQFGGRTVGAGIEFVGAVLIASNDAELEEREMKRGRRRGGEGRGRKYAQLIERSAGARLGGALTEKRGRKYLSHTAQ